MNILQYIMTQNTIKKRQEFYKNRGDKMNYCKYCNYYEDRDSYPNKGWCDMHLTYVREDDNCDDFEEDDD